MLVPLPVFFFSYEFSFYTNGETFVMNVTGCLQYAKLILFCIAINYFYCRSGCTCKVLVFILVQISIFIGQKVNFSSHKQQLPHRFVVADFCLIFHVDRVPLPMKQIAYPYHKDIHGDRKAVLCHF